MAIAFVWAESIGGVIGQQGRLPWHLPADLKHFKTLTWRQTIILGHRTWQSFPNQQPLPQREHWVLTHQPAHDFPNAVTVFNDATALRQAVLRQPEQDFYVIGGVALFKLFADLVTDLYCTKIDHVYLGDVVMPRLALNQFDLLAQQVVPATKSSPQLTFEHWQRRN
ncbi:MAG: dihydrofolate reductase [Lactobacillaceae bacterium]|jgi:dihydrofolate reductase|nr:dihydrofolate reductase [Lactobacillaceae bacterium]